MDGQQSEKREKFEKEVAAHPFLLGMNEQHVRLLADCAMHSHFHTDGIIFREGEAANRFYLIVRGKIRLESSTLGEPVPIDEIHDGDLLGWSWLFPPYAWHFTARAGRNRRDFLLRHDFAGVLRERSLPRLRALQANERRHAETTASRAPEVNDRPTDQKSLTFSNPESR